MPARTLDLKGVDWGVPHILDEGMRMLGSKGGSIVRSHVGLRGEQNIIHRHHFKNLERKLERKSPKRTESTSGELELLQYNTIVNVRDS